MTKGFKIVVIVVILTLLLCFFCWRVPIILKIETLRLPDDCEVVYPTKVRTSDVYWFHIKGEKVIKCDIGYEAAKEYIEIHNSWFKLTNISIYEYGGMSDIAIYDSEFDDYFEKQPDKDKYIKISYLKKWDWFPFF